MKKEFFEIELHSLIFDKEKRKCNTDYDFDSLWFDTDQKAHELSEKYPLLEKNLESKWKNDLQVIPKEILKSSLNRLIQFIKKQPLDNFTLNWNVELCYWWNIKKKDIDFIESELDNNIDLFRRDMVFKTSAWDTFHSLYSHCYSNIWYLKMLYRKRKLSSDDWRYIRGVIEYFWSRMDNFEREKDYFYKKRVYKKSKKNVYVFNIDVKAQIDDWGDRLSEYQDNFNIVISHKSKDLAEEMLLRLKDYWENYKSITWLIKEFCSSWVILSENQVKLVLLSNTKENINKAKDFLSKKYVRYCSWGSFNF